MAISKSEDITTGGGSFLKPSYSGETIGYKGKIKNKRTFKGKSYDKNKKRAKLLYKKLDKAFHAAEKKPKSKILSQAYEQAAADFAVIRHLCFLEESRRENISISMRRVWAERKAKI